MIAEAERKNSEKSYGKGFYQRRDNNSDERYHRREKNWGDRKDVGRDLERHRRDSRSRSRERKGSDDRRDRFKNRENYASSKESVFRERRLGFKKPDEESNLNAASTSRLPTSSSSSKNWKKPEARERDIRKEMPRSDNKSESESEEDSDPKSNEKEIIDTIMTEAEMNQLGAKIVKCEIMGDDVS